MTMSPGVTPSSAQPRVDVVGTPSTSMRKSGEAPADSSRAPAFNDEVVTPLANDHDRDTKSFDSVPVAVVPFASTGSDVVVAAAGTAASNPPDGSPAASSSVATPATSRPPVTASGRASTASDDETARTECDEHEQDGVRRLRHDRVRRCTDAGRAELRLPPGRDEGVLLERRAGRLHGVDVDVGAWEVHVGAAQLGTHQPLPEGLRQVEEEVVVADRIRAASRCRD